MKKTMILLTGYPATGKSYMCRQILQAHPGMVVVSQDDMKEQLWDAYGFDSMEEKTALETQSWAAYYQTVEAEMEKGSLLISDYPFSDKQKGRLEALAQAHGYQFITIRLTGDIDTLYQRSRQRDLDPSRHLGHLVSRYHKGDVMADRSQADCFVTLDVFRQRCLTRGYDTFCLGHLIAVDATDFSRIDYPRIVARVTALMEGE